MVGWRVPQAMQGGKVSSRNRQHIRTAAGKRRGLRPPQMYVHMYKLCALASRISQYLPMYTAFLPRSCVHDPGRVLRMYVTGACRRHCDVRDSGSQGSFWKDSSNSLKKGMPMQRSNNLWGIPHPSSLAICAWRTRPNLPPHNAAARTEYIQIP